MCSYFITGIILSFFEQDKTTGAFDESGPPLSQTGSDTYHMWSMIGTYNYVLYTNNTDFLLENWDGYQLAMDYIYGKVTYASGLLDVTGIRDWARWQQGYNNSEAQMMYAIPRNLPALSFLSSTLLFPLDFADW